MRKVYLMAISLVCSIGYGYGHTIVDRVAILKVEDALDCDEGYVILQSGRSKHKKRARKQVRSEDAAPQPVIQDTTLKTSDANSVNHSEDSMLQSVTGENTLKVTDVDSLNRDEEAVSRPAVEKSTLKVKKVDNLRRDNTMLPSTMKVVIGDILDKENFLGQADKVMIRTCLSDAVENHGRGNIEVYERTDVDAIAEERSFQQSGHVQESQIKRMGDMIGVDCILIPEVMKLNDKQILLTAKLINITTGKMAGGTPIKRCNVEYNSYCAICQQLVEALLSRLIGK